MRDAAPEGDSSKTWQRTAVEVPGPGGSMTLDVQSIGAGSAGHTVLALHGFPQSSRCWQAVGERLAASGVRVVAPDQRGYSPRARPEPVDAYRMPALVQDGLAAADAFGLERFHVLGHDWGANVGWALAAHAPDRVQTLTALSVPHPRAFARAYKEDPEQREASAYIGLFWEAGKAEEVLAEDDFRRLRSMIEPLGADEVEHYVTRLRAPGALTGALNWYRAMESARDFPEVTVPTTYLWSTADIALRRRGAELCGEYVDADYRYVELEGISHWIPDEAPEAVADAVLDRIRHA